MIWLWRLSVDDATTVVTPACVVYIVKGGFFSLSVADIIYLVYIISCLMISYLLAHQDLPQIYYYYFDE